MNNVARTMNKINGVSDALATSQARLDEALGVVSIMMRNSSLSSEARSPDSPNSLQDSEMKALFGLHRLLIGVEQELISTDKALMDLIYEVGDQEWNFSKTQGGAV